MRITANSLAVKPLHILGDRCDLFIRHGGNDTPHHTGGIVIAFPGAEILQGLFQIRGMLTIDARKLADGFPPPAGPWQAMQAATPEEAFPAR